ncbi:MAG: hypothetical protein IPP64_04775 [Bacteroidetes bacterium]|nr:hypothetical protein [Bacteroidota bacterium]
MTQLNNTEMNTTEAVVYLKNGKRKYGLILEEVINDTYQFISNVDYFAFLENKNQEYIEELHASTIETIDTNLK